MKAKRLLAIILAMIMMLSFSSVVAFANDEPTDPGAVTGQSILQYEEGAYFDVGFTKLVASGKGVGLPDSDPNIKYSFTVEQVGDLTVRDGAPGGESKSYTVEPVGKGAPSGKDDSLGIAGTYYASPTTSRTVTDPAQFGYSASTDYYVAETSILHNRENETPNYTLPFRPEDIEGSGADGVAIYAYKITEQKIIDPDAGWKKETVNGKTVYTRPDPPTEVVGEYNEKITLSLAEYIMYVYTKASELGGRYIFAITAVQTINDDGTTTETVDKKNITIGGSTGIDGDWSEMVFQNDYVKTPVEDPEDPEGTPFQISKIVTGVENDAKLLEEQEYEFTVKITKSESDDATEVIGRLWDSDDGETYYPVAGTEAEFNAGTAVELSGEKNYEADYQKIVKFTFTGNVATGTVKLKNNQKITFPEVASGTTFEVEEADYYTTPLTDSGGNELPLFPFVQQKKGTSDEVQRPSNDATAEAKKAAVDQARAYKAITEDDVDKAADYVNDGATGSTPTGIITQYLPFFLIIALAIVALIVYVIFRGRRRALTH